MAKVRVAVNGFGRIGRNIVRAIFEWAARILTLWPSMTSDRLKPTPISCATIRCMAAFPMR